MKTVVYQSYRTSNVSDWLGRCMETVRQWATLNGFDYRFIDDQLFSYVPDWYLKKADKNICFIANLARLTLAKELLEQGYERTVWVDADIVVFDPDGFKIELTEGHAFCHEVWVEPGPDGQPVCSHRVNNSVTVFTKQNDLLDFHIHACQRVAKYRSQVSNLDVGTVFLTKLRGILPFPLLADVGLFSPPVMADIAAGDGRFLRGFARQIASPLRAANLCASFREKTFYGVPMADRLYETVLENCLRTKGEIVNRHFQGAPDARVRAIVEGRD